MANANAMVRVTVPGGGFTQLKDGSFVDGIGFVSLTHGHYGFGENGRFKLIAWPIIEHNVVLDASTAALAVEAAQKQGWTCEVIPCSES